MKLFAKIAATAFAASLIIPAVFAQAPAAPMDKKPMMKSSSMKKPMMGKKPMMKKSMKGKKMMKKGMMAPKKAM